MYERFTDRARKCMQLANQEAQRFNHEYIGTEHVLLGLVKEAAGVAAVLLRDLGVDLRKVRLEVEKLIQSGPDMVTMGKLPQTPRAKKVIEYAIEAARELNHNYVGTEHLLLGLVREQEGVAHNVLENLGVTTETVVNHLGLMLNKDIRIQEKITKAVSNQDFEEAARWRNHLKLDAEPTEKATEDHRKETLRQIICAILGNLHSRYGDKVTLHTIKQILEERGTD